MANNSVFSRLGGFLKLFLVWLVLFIIILIVLPLTLKQILVVGLVLLLLVVGLNQFLKIDFGNIFKKKEEVYSLSEAKNKMVKSLDLYREGWNFDLEQLGEYKVRLILTRPASKQQLQCFGDRRKSLPEIRITSPKPFQQDLFETHSKDLQGSAFHHSNDIYSKKLEGLLNED